MVFKPGLQNPPDVTLQVSPGVCHPPGTLLVSPSWCHPPGVTLLVSPPRSHPPSTLRRPRMFLRRQGVSVLNLLELDPRSCPEDPEAGP